jgi:acyl-CoA thioester hydrolase
VTTEHTQRFRVAWVDTDAGGRIHFTAAFRWAEATETSLWRALGLIDGQSGNWPRRHVEAEFLRALVFEDKVEVRLRVERIGTTSLTFTWDVVHEGEVAIAGRHTVVQVGADGRAAPLTEEVRTALAG